MVVLERKLMCYFSSISDHDMEDQKLFCFPYLKQRLKYKSSLTLQGCQYSTHFFLMLQGGRNLNSSYFFCMRRSSEVWGDTS